MSLRSFALKPIALAALLGLAGSAHAAFTTYDSSAAFAAATSSLFVGTDTYNSLTGTGQGTGAVLTRSAGTVGYTVTDSDPTSQLYNLSGALSTDGSGDGIVYGNFSRTVYAVGGNFFNTLGSGDFAPGEALRLTVVDAAGSHDFLYSNITSASAYFGIVSTSAITSFSFTGTSGAAYATVDNFQLGAVAAVPEPETYALMLAGLGIVGFLRKRQQRAA